MIRLHHFWGQYASDDGLFSDAMSPIAAGKRRATTRLFPDDRDQSDLKQPQKPSLTFREIPVECGVNGVSDRFDVSICPEKVCASRVTAIKLALIGILAVRSDPTVTDDTPRGIFPIEDCAYPG